MTGLVYAVPQIIFPGKVFERKYNANSIAKIKTGFFFTEDYFNADKIITTINKFKKDISYKINAEKFGNNLLKLGGVSKLVDILED